MPEISKQALKVENNQSFPNNNVGEITPAILRTFNVNMIDSNVNQLGFTTDSGSWNNSIRALNNYTASTTTSVDVTYLNQATASLQQFSASAKIQLANLETTTASLNISVSNLNTFTSSTNIRLANLESTSASVNISVANLNTYTASAANSFIQLNAFTASANQRLTSIESVSGSWITESETSSFARYDVSNPWSANQTFTNITAVSASFTYVQTIYETSSVIYSSGSNQFGDEIIDVQTLIGTTRMSGSMVLTGSIALTGLVDGIDVSVFASNVNTTTASLNTSVSNLNSFSSSQLTKDSTLQTYTASVNQTTASLNTFSASTLTRLSNIETTTASLNTSVTNINLATASLQGQLTTIGSISGSWVTESETGSFARVNTNNSFTGSQTLSGSLIITGSAYGNVAAITVAASTASIDFSLANFFTLAIPTATTTRVVATNIRPGQTVSLLVTQPATTGSLTFDTSFDFPSGFAYSASAISGAKDIVTFITFDSAIAYGTSVKNLL